MEKTKVKLEITSHMPPIWD